MIFVILSLIMAFFVILMVVVVFGSKSSNDPSTITCSKYQTLSTTTNTCVCKSGYTRSVVDPTACCPTGQDLNDDGVCNCTNGGDITSVCDCYDGMTLDPTLNKCICDAGTTIASDGETCCYPSQDVDANGVCKCIDGYYTPAGSDGTVCCPVGLNIVNGVCTCPFSNQTYFELGGVCCGTGQKYDINSGSCICSNPTFVPASQVGDFKGCCGPTGTTITLDSTDGTCQCPPGQYITAGGFCEDSIQNCVGSWGSTVMNGTTPVYYSSDYTPMVCRQGDNDVVYTATYFEIDTSPNSGGDSCFDVASQSLVGSSSQAFKDIYGTIYRADPVSNNTILPKCLVGCTVDASDWHFSDIDADGNPIPDIDGLAKITPSITYIFNTGDIVADVSTLNTNPGYFTVQCPIASQEFYKYVPMSQYNHLGTGVNKSLLTYQYCDDGVYWDGDLNDPPTSNYGSLENISGSGWKPVNPVYGAGHTLLQVGGWKNACASSDNIPGCYTMGALNSLEWTRDGTTSDCLFTMYNNNASPNLECSNDNYQGYIINPNIYGQGQPPANEPALMTACVYSPAPKVMATISCSGNLMPYLGSDRPLVNPGLIPSDNQFADGTGNNRFYLPVKDDNIFVDATNVNYNYSEEDPNHDKGPGCYQAFGEGDCIWRGCTPAHHHQWKWQKSQEALTITCPPGYVLSSDSSDGVFWCEAQWCDLGDGLGVIQVPSLGYQQCKCPSDYTETYDGVTGLVTCTDRNQKLTESFYVDYSDHSQGTYQKAYGHN